MPIAKLSLAIPFIIASGIAASGVELTRPYEALEQAGRARVELDTRLKREEAERQKQEKQNQTKRKREEAEQRKRQREEKTQQEAQRKRDATAAKAAQDARSPPKSLPSQPSTAPTLAHQPSEIAPATPPTATRKAAERQQDIQNASAPPQVGAETRATPPPTPSVTTEVDERRPLVQDVPPARPPVGIQTSTTPPSTLRTTGEADEGPPQARSESARQGGHQGSVPGGGPPSAGATSKVNGTTPDTARGGDSVAVFRLKRMDLYNERGDKLGDVERVVQRPDGEVHIVIGAGGFLGIRERDIAIPLERVRVRENRLVAPGLTNDQVKTMTVFDRGDRRYRNLPRNTTVLVVRDRPQ